LTKPLGIGIISTGIKGGMASEEATTRIIKSMSTLNRKASEVMQEVGVQACTDITGFGLLGHAAEMIEGTGVITFGTERSGMTLKDLSITTSLASAIFSWGLYNSRIENVTVKNSSVSKWMINMGYITSTFTISNFTMLDNSALYSDFGMRLTGSIIKMDNILMKDNQTLGMPESEFNRGCGGFDIAIANTLCISNSKFIDNTHYSEDGFANFRVFSDWMQYSPTYTFDNCLFANNITNAGARNIDIFEGHTLNIVNCTFANNSGVYADYLLLGTEINNITNCLFSNNNAAYEIRTTSETTIQNCLFNRSDNLWRTYSGSPLTWGEHNITGTNPLFVGGNPAIPSYYYLCDDATHGYSPAINAGTTDMDDLPIGYQIPQFDAFGYNRIHGSGIDIGCFESPGYTGNIETPVLASNQIALSNYPNPFNPSTTIKYSVPKNGNVKLNIYNLKGQLVKTLVAENRKAGKHTVVWNGDDNTGRKTSSGMYFSRLETGGKTLTLKMLLMK
jgi:hypothetical protein